MGEETSVRSPRKISSGHVRVWKQLKTVVLDLKRWRLDPEAFQSIQLDISMIFMYARYRVRVVNSQNDRDT